MGQSHPLTKPAGAENCPGEPGAPQGDEIREELGRIVSSARFRGSLRLTGFITFVVEATLAGDAGTIKSYTIALGALGRGSDFDPQTDPIVRVEAGRLRQALARYYAAEGRDDPLVIEVPRGTYVPTFHHRVAATAKPSARPSGDAPTLIESKGRSGRRPESGSGHREFVHLLSEFQDLMQIHLMQVSALTAEIVSARQTLRSLRALLQLADNSGVRLPPSSAAATNRAVHPIWRSAGGKWPTRPTRSRHACRGGWPTAGRRKWPRRGA
jgi:hypothetical protein